MGCTLEIAIVYRYLYKNCKKYVYHFEAIICSYLVLPWFGGCVGFRFGFLFSLHDTLINGPVTYSWPLMMPAAYREASGDRASVTSVNPWIRTAGRGFFKNAEFKNLVGYPSLIQLSKFMKQMKTCEKTEKPLNSSRLRSEGIAETISNSES